MGRALFGEGTQAMLWARGVSPRTERGGAATTLVVAGTSSPPPSTPHRGGHWKVLKEADPGIVDGQVEVHPQAAGRRGKPFFPGGCGKQHPPAKQVHLSRDRRVGEGVAVEGDKHCPRSEAEVHQHSHHRRNGRNEGAQRGGVDGKADGRHPHKRVL